MDDKRLERIEAKVDDVSDHLSSIDTTLAAQHVSLREHMRRTALLEKELAPIKNHVLMVKGALKLVGVLAAGAALAESLHMLMK